MSEEGLIEVEVAYALPTEQYLIKLKLADGSTAFDAVRQSGILASCPALADKGLQFGIYSKPISQETVLKAGDRVEIYRDLSIDPKLKRMIRAKNQSI